MLGKHDCAQQTIDNRERDMRAGLRLLMASQDISWAGDGGARDGTQEDLGVADDG